MCEEKHYTKSGNSSSEHFIDFSKRKHFINSLKENSEIKMLTFDEVTRSMQVDPTSKTPYSDATQVSYNRCGEHPSR